MNSSFTNLEVGIAAAVVLSTVDGDELPVWTIPFII